MFKKYSGAAIPILIILLYFSIFRQWFSVGVLSGGDWPYLYPQAVTEVMPLSTWDMMFNNGMGQNALPKMWFESYASIVLKLANLLTWPVFERVAWFFPYLLISFFGSFIFSGKFFKDKNVRFLSGLIYSLNTYSLLVVSGGQAGVFIAYAFLPFVFNALFNLLESLTIKKSIIFSLALALLILLDLRVGYMFLFAECLLSLIYIFYNRGKLPLKILYLFILPAIISFLLHFFWILPMIFMGRNPTAGLTDIYTSSSSLSFFSFARLENAIGLLHPNWPENLFGKVAFLRPEFLIIPILAFSSLYFVSKEKTNKTYLLSLVLLAIVGIFLAKGVNDPFGIVYETFFNTIPGFVMFRDPTKWYMLIAISFSILIPYSLLKISEYLNKKIKNVTIYICIAFLFFWAFLIRDSFNGTLKGTLYPRQIPANYQEFADRISKDSKFSRTLWVPVYPTLAYVSNTHPAIPAVELFRATSTANLVSILQNPATEQILVDSSIKYVVVPEDIYGKIFLTDRKYDEKVYKKTLGEIEEITYLTKVPGYGKLGIFEVKNPRGHFWGVGGNLQVSSKYISPTEYLVELQDATKGDVLVFSDTHDKFWLAENENQNLQSQQFKVSENIEYNSFILDENGTYDLYVTYKPQEWLNLGLVVSGISLGAIIFVLIKTRKDK